MGVRWDAVVERGGFWSEVAPDAAFQPPRTGAAGCRDVRVWLFGSLAEAAPERPLHLTLALPFTVDDVVGELGRRCGEAFLSRATGPGGGLHNHCRVYVNGEEIEDSAALLGGAGPGADIEMILLTAAEGG